ncbi:MAG TPA: PEP-CTERM sorting domain-containing protein [Candidatus Omnitrophota bacterium]|nr:PEP-CTERM sorting domain-containing protein [Candidatus Omnitrophota bacterium]HPS19622.1 PEP-CTERM sorting domain-containing protein [Candidatus Omnitrophota bacterium]
MKKSFFMILVVILVMSSRYVNADTISNWDDPSLGFDGWSKASTNATMEYFSTGGNPDGYLRVSANLNMGFKASSIFNGNYANLGYDHFGFDLKVFLQQLPAYKPYVLIRYSSSYNGWAYTLNDFDIADTSWCHYEVYFDPLWTDEEAILNGWEAGETPVKSFSETMSHVGVLSISQNYPSIAGRTLGLDNFSVGSSTTPEPSALLLFGIGGALIRFAKRRDK